MPLKILLNIMITHHPVYIVIFKLIWTHINLYSTAHQHIYLTFFYAISIEWLAFTGLNCINL